MSLSIENYRYLNIRGHGARYSDYLLRAQIVKTSPNFSELTVGENQPRVTANINVMLIAPRHL